MSSTTKVSNYNQTKQKLTAISIDRNLQRNRADSRWQHGFVVCLGLAHLEIATTLDRCAPEWVDWVAFCRMSIHRRRSSVNSEMCMDWIHPWIGLDWVRWLLCTKLWWPMFFSAVIHAAHVHCCFFTFQSWLISIIDWVSKLVDWVGLYLEKWTHGHLWVNFRGARHFTRKICIKN